MALVVGMAAGLAVSPHWSPRRGVLEASIALFLILVLLVERSPSGGLPLSLILVAALIAGSGIGGLRLERIDDGALRQEPGTRVDVSGFISGESGTSRGITRLPIQTESGKAMVETTQPPAGIDVGSGIEVEGIARPPPDWYRSTLKRQGIETLIADAEIKSEGTSRSGLTGWIDSLRRRAEAALEAGIPPRESALAKGFVLGQDADIDERTTRDFQDSGLAHLLAVSGQNVVLLGLLAIPLMAIAGFGPRTRILTVAILILIYVPVTGAGASIQRAGVMGIAGLVATLAARPASRLYALALAALFTLALNPRAGADIGWQLSFAAVIGIFLFTRPLQARIEALAGGGGWKSVVAGGVAVTIAATVATAPLMVFHFERLPVATIGANLLAMPAVAPAMWLGMVSAAAGQIHEALALPFNLVNSLLLGYIAQIATWLGRPDWAVIELGIDGPGQLALIYVALGGAMATFFQVATPGRLGQDRPPAERRRARRFVFVSATALVLLLVAVSMGSVEGRRELRPPPDGGARIEVLDIGQGDAILIRPDGQEPTLVDGGPPGGELLTALDSAGVDSLAAVVLTHGDLDHTGGLYDLFGKVEVDRFLFDGVPGDLKRMADAAGASPFRVELGQKISSGPVKMEVLWPPALEPGESRPEDPNDRSVVLQLEANGFRMLLTGDTEYEASPFETGPLDVLKVAHHGSDDAGLANLLAADDPEVAIISVGADNRYGHPTPAVTAALAEAGVEVHRTDREGTVSVIVGSSGYSIEVGE